MLTLIDFTRDENTHQLTVVLTMDGPEAKGKVTLKEHLWGWDVYFGDQEGEECPVSIDLFYCVDGGPPQLLLYSPLQKDENIGNVRFLPEQTQVRLDPAMQPLWTEGERRTYGLPLDVYPVQEEETDGQSNRSA